MTIFVGEAPALSFEGYDAFVPRSRSGARLAEVLGVIDVRQVAKTVNLFENTYTTTLATAEDWRERASDVYNQYSEQNLVLVGAKVAEAFCVGPRWHQEYEWLVPFTYESANDTRMLVIPHPSGRNRWWNSRPLGSDGWLEARRVMREFLGPRFKIKVASQVAFSEWHAAGHGWDVGYLVDKVRSSVPGEYRAHVTTLSAYGHHEGVYNGRVRHLDQLVERWGEIDHPMQEGNGAVEVCGPSCTRARGHAGLCHSLVEVEHVLHQILNYKGV